VCFSWYYSAAQMVIRRCDAG